MIRRVQPEILDHLAAEDPAARRSRLDLQRIHWAMGNFRWVERSFSRDPASIVEIGAGDGSLGRRLMRRFPSARVTGLDRVPGPPGVDWKQGDLFELLPECAAEALIGVMILHHFEKPELGRLGKWLDHFHELRFCEPWRSRVSHRWGRCLHPFFGPVTRHDLPVSVEAGFRPGELAGLLQLGPAWTVRETVDWRGSLRFAASRS